MCGAKHILNATINLDKTVTVDWIEGADAYYCSRELMEKIFDRFNETTALLTKLRDEVEGLKIAEGMYVTAFYEQGWRHHKLSVIALLEKAGE